MGCSQAAGTVPLINYSACTMKSALVVKLLSLLGIVLMLGVLLNQIGDLGAERQGRQMEAQRSIEASQAERQTLVGPLIHSTCTQEWTEAIGDGASVKHTPMRQQFTLSAPPSRLSIDAQAALEPRYRGIFKINTYAAKTKVTAEWNSLQALKVPPARANGSISCAPPILTMAVTDARGIRRVMLQIKDQAMPILPGTEHKGHPRGFHSPLPEALRLSDKPLTARIELDLIGTSELSFAPIADSTDVKLKSDWPHPSFGGRFLPVQRDIEANGFQAEWQISALGTTAPDALAKGSAVCAASDLRDNCIETFSVSFMDPVNTYSLSDRAVKYGFLFVGLTFMALALVEALRHLRVHPIQYLLVGCALSIFFLLLLSLSEHLPFGVSYAVAASACVILLTAYARYLLQGWGAGLLLGAGIASLYGCLYVLLQMEQTAMMIGSMMLFGVLATAMILTRQLDWYALFKVDRAMAPRAPSANA